MIHTVKGFDIVKKAEIDVFLELCCFFNDPADVGNLISDSSAFSKSSFNIWKFTVHVLLNPGLENFEHYFASIEMSALLWQFEHYIQPHGLYIILQARILEWVGFPFSRGSSQPRDRTQVSRVAGRFFTS